MNVVTVMVENWGWFLLIGGFLCWAIVSTFVMCSGTNDKVIEDDTKFTKWLNELVLEKTIITTNSDGSKSTQKIYKKRQGDGRPWGINGIC